MKQEHFCSHCGIKIIETGSKFCGNCGSVLDVSLKTVDPKQSSSQNKSSVQSGFRTDFRTILILSIPIIAIILFVVVVIGDFIVENQSDTVIDNMAKAQYVYLDQNQNNCITRSELNRYKDTDFPFFERLLQFQDESEFTKNGKYAFWEYGSFQDRQVEEKYYRERENLRTDIDAYYKDNNEATEHPYKEWKEQLDEEHSEAILNLLYLELDKGFDNCISAERWDPESLELREAYFETIFIFRNVFDVLPGVATLLLFASPFVMVVFVYIFPRSKQDKSDKNQKLFFIILLLAIAVGIGSCISSGF